MQRWASGLGARAKGTKDRVPISDERVPNQKDGTGVRRELRDERFRRPNERGDDAGAFAVGSHIVQGPSDLAAVGVERGHDEPPCSRNPSERLERPHPDHREGSRLRPSGRSRDADAQARESARPATHGQALDRVGGQAEAFEHLVDGREKPLQVPHRRTGHGFGQDPGRIQDGRARDRRSGLYGEDTHRWSAATSRS
jgi:hypothetical protein